MKILQLTLVLISINICCASSRQLQLVPPQFYINPASTTLLQHPSLGSAGVYTGSNAQPSRVYSGNNAQPTGVYTGSSSPVIGYINPYAPRYPYSPTFAYYTPGINSPFGAQPYVRDQGESVPSLEPSTLSKSHVQFNPLNALDANVGDVQFQLQDLNTRPGQLAFTSSLSQPFYSYSLTRSLCLSCSCEEDYGCSYNCDKCEGLCHSCSCETSIGCQYNCDKCQTDKRNVDTENSEDNAEGSGDDDSSTSMEEDSNSSDLEESVSSSSNNEDEMESTGEEASVIENTPDQSAETDTTVEDDEDDSSESGLVNPTFPLVPAGTDSILGTAPGFVDNTVEETETEEVDEAQETDGSGGGEEEEEAGVDCSPLESGEADLCSWGPSCQSVLSAVYPGCNYNCTSCAFTPTDDCVASSGSAAGSSCVFPFIYKGMVYKGCAPLHNSEGRSLDFWCSTKTDINGIHITGPFEDPGKYVGLCDASCPRDIPGFKLW